MKVNNRTTSFALVASLLALSSCDKFLDVNQNPNAVLEAPAPNVLVAGQAHLGFLMGSDLHRYSALIVQQFAGQGGSGIQTAEYDRYNITATDLNNAWRGNIFGGAQADLQKLIDQSAATSPAYSGVAKIMQGFLFSVTTDAFGDIPFTEALKFDQNLQPKYDASAAVYTGIIELLNSGIADLKKTSVTSPADDDLIYAGDLVKWEKFANTLKLRLYLHNFPKLSQTSDASFAAVLAAGPVMTGNEDNFELDFEAAANKNNSIDQFEKSRPSTFFPSTTLVNLMNAKEDPRRTTFLTEQPSLAAPAPQNPAGTYVGAQNGTGAAGAPQIRFSRMGTYLRGIRTGTGINSYDGSAPIRMLTFAEHNFILAEYYARTNNLALAQTSFNAGITASMTAASVAGSDATAYIAARPPLTSANAIQQIIEEKFIANFGVAVEPWTDYRRTGFPVLPLPVGALQPQVLRVLPYPDLERVANPTNTPARPDLTAPTVFWDPGR
ncbi:SusD/RagB family nutrient-binding outer membrane lipoprotein [Hymenobacter sp. IS2118]|uniref:SusD/RagB family nutrient-binding outer membrane lipoprotein n=1 Tax=Hymenobacter sp. IS2118 TaxID=1505605 RepID=UPI00054DE2DC|nr:SusD/RagB family nutrient-binding outer membrane lipoprotein [Hymenobacter sp. IS2118]